MIIIICFIIQLLLFHTSNQLTKYPVEECFENYCLSWDGTTETYQNKAQMEKKCSEGLEAHYQKSFLLEIYTFRLQTEVNYFVKKYFTENNFHEVPFNLVYHTDSSKYSNMKYKRDYFADLKFFFNEFLSKSNGLNGWIWINNSTEAFYFNWWDTEFGLEKPTENIDNQLFTFYANYEDNSWLHRETKWGQDALLSVICMRSVYDTIPEIPIIPPIIPIPLHPATASYSDLFPSNNLITSMETNFGFIIGLLQTGTTNSLATTNLDEVLELIPIFSFDNSSNTTTFPSTISTSTTDDNVKPLIVLVSFNNTENEILASGSITTQILNGGIIHTVLQPNKGESKDKNKRDLLMIFGILALVSVIFIILIISIIVILKSKKESHPKYFLI